MSELINFYKTLKKQTTLNPHFDVHKIALPFRGIICCGSGGGKSNLLLNLLHLMTDTFTSIIIVSKAAEPLYDMIKERCPKVAVYYDGKIPEISKLAVGTNGVIVFDDLILDKKPEIGQMYIRGRKLGYSSLYISQSFYLIDKIIRINSTMIWLGRGLLARDLNCIASEFSIMDKKELIKTYQELTSVPMHFMLVDIEGRNIRRNISQIVQEF